MIDVQPVMTEHRVSPGAAQRWQTCICHLLVLCILTGLFAENFIFSANFGILGFREVDDVAFQASLRAVHDALRGGQLHKFFALNDYAYGWVFWAPMAALTYPFYLLSQWTGVEWPLIVLPRMVSWLFTVFSLLVMRRLLKQLAVPDWACALGLLIFVLTPAMGYFAMRFGTVSPVAFFSLLSVHLALRDDVEFKTSLRQSLLSLAVAGGIKLSGLLVLPLVGLLLLIRLKRAGLPWLSTLFKPSVVFVGSLALLTNPQFLILPVKHQVWAQYWEILSNVIEGTRTPSGPANPVERLYLGALGTPCNALAMAILAAGWAHVAWRDRARRWDFVAIMAVVAVAALYLGCAVKNHISVGSYFTSVAFLAVLGVVGLVQHRSGRFALLLVVLLLIADVWVRYDINRTAKVCLWSHAGYFTKQARVAKDVGTANQVSECMAQTMSGRRIDHVFIDYTAPANVNALSLPGTCVSVAWDNLDPKLRYCPRPVDLLVLDARDAVGTLDQARFDARLKATNKRTEQGYLIDRATRRRLGESGWFGDQRFALACDLGRVRVYRALP